MAKDLLLIGFLAFLEGILSVDNALVLAIQARRLPRELQRKALTYGLVGAIGFRLAALILISLLMRWTWIKYVGAAYLVGMALHHLLSKKAEGEEEIAQESSPRADRGDSLYFWKTVLTIELLDIAFAIDSILAAFGLTQKLWIIFTGGFLGVILMRFAATAFVTLLNRFPRFETTAYLLILVIGIKLIAETLGKSMETEIPSWIFWAMMGALALNGLRPKSR